MMVRRISHALGFRFRLHKRSMPGTPDLVFPRLMSVIFVHGCFWHRHSGCKKASAPTTRADYWAAKFARNIERDATAVIALEQAGWRVLIVWQCELNDAEVVRSRIHRFLRAGATQSRGAHRNTS
jgi:DNA mismatch endonuclease, patch repair protein